jgi:hypothetical protein
MSGALFPGALVAIIVPSYSKQGIGASFKMKGEEGHRHSDSLKIERSG